ncbi:MAG: acyl-ACP--UDP-N-acetylglucosamine O-acyltransferase [Candidatus Sumerlaeota bacterium]|nr:acyl-ACP--UDP-N-acetylglucosamine O-acyltransferase [Candidatus Sumerlaeota bacterium]
MPIHPTAVIDPRAEIDPTAEIGPHVVVEGPARIGPRTRILAHAVICQWTEIGADNVIHYGAVIGDEPQHLGYKGEERWTRIGAGNIIREYVTIHRGYEESTGGHTIVGDHCLLMALSHVGHDSVVGNRVIVANGSLIAGHCTVEDNVNISGNVAIRHFARIGRLAMIGGGARVRSDVPPFMMVEGNSRIVNMNVIGLRRAGIDVKGRAALKAAYKTLYHKGLPFREALKAIRDGEMTPEVAHLVEFIEASKLGICKHRRRGEAEDEDVE